MENSMKNSNAVIAFCRMNPFTKGHQKLIEKVRYLSRLLNAHHEIILSHSHNKHNPLPLDEKLQFARKFFWPMNFTSSSNEAPTILYHFDRLREEGYKHITVVAGSDRIEGFQNLVDSYDIPDVSVISAGSRSPDELTASKLREAARNGDYATFKKGTPSHLKERDIEELYLATRKGLNLINT